MEPEWCVPIFLFLYIPVSSISFEYNFSQGFAIIKWPTKWHLYDGMVVSANARWSSFHNIWVYPIKTLHTLHLHNVLCQLYLKAAGARRKGSGKKPRDPTAFLVVCSLSRVRLCDPTSWCHLILQGNLPNPELEPGSPALVGGFFTTAPPGKPIYTFIYLRWLQSPWSCHAKPRL